MADINCLWYMPFDCEARDCDECMFKECDEDEITESKNSSFQAWSERFKEDYRKYESV